MAATTDTNINYQRYSDTAGVTTTQPASVAGTSDPGAGWINRPYLNFSGGYDRHDENNVDVPNPAQNAGDYVRHDENNNVGIVSAYVRHDENNQPV